MLTPFEASQLAATADAIISEMDRGREVGIERMFQLLNTFRDRLPDSPMFTHRGYRFSIAVDSAGEEGVEVTMPTPAPNSL